MQGIKMTAKNIYMNPVYKDYVFNSKQRIKVLYGGRDSGKSYFVGGQYIPLKMHSLDYFKGVGIRKTLTSCKDSIYQEIIDGYIDCGLDQVLLDRKSPLEIENTYKDNKFLFRGLDKPRKLKSLKGISHIWVEEAEDLTYQEFMDLLILLRGGDEQALILTFNPKHPAHFANDMFVRAKPDKVIAYDDNGKPKVWVVIVEVELEDDNFEIEALVVKTTYKDNEFITPARKAVIESFKAKDPYTYKVYAEGEYATPEGAAFPYDRMKRYKIKELNKSSIASVKAVIDTANTGTDNATLGIYAKVDDNHIYLLDCIRDGAGAKEVVPRMSAMINKYNVDTVYIEENYEGLYYEDKIKSQTTSQVQMFRTSANKHEKILGQAGTINDTLYYRDKPHTKEYENWITEVSDYNRDIKLNKKVDCPDNQAMYYKHATVESSWW